MKPPEDFQIKRLFKYPSLRYQGEREPAEPAKPTQQMPNAIVTPPSATSAATVLNEPDISGKVLEAYFEPWPHSINGALNALAIILRMQISNDGIPTLIQDYRLTYVFFGHDFPSEVAPTTNLKIKRFERDGTERLEELPDLRTLNGEPLQRHLPRVGWLCFTLDRPPVRPSDPAHSVSGKLKLEIIDGVNNSHQIESEAPFTNAGRIEGIA
jgi:hypothetical protein